MALEHDNDDAAEPELTAVGRPPVGRLSGAEQRFLRYWSLLMVFSGQCDWRWIPGFGYADDEEHRIRSLAARIPTAARAAWLAASAAILVLTAVASVALLMGFAILTVWSGRADIPDGALYAVLAMAAVVAISATVPLSVVWGGAIADRFGVAVAAPPRAIDLRIFGDALMQLRRAGFTAAIVFLIAALAWLALLD